MGILERVERIHRGLGDVPTICKVCGKAETMKFYDTDKEKLPKGSFTTKCDCGTWIYKFHNIHIKPDPNNQKSYFTKAFLDVKLYGKDSLEQLGFKKNSSGHYER